MASNDTLAHPPALHLRLTRTVTLAFLLSSCLALPAVATAADGEMGSGVPHFGQYSQATGVQTIVWNLEEGTVPFPAGCPNIVLTPATMGMDAYKMAVATMLVSRVSRRPVRFYAHASRDGGCGVDYVELR